MSEGRPALPRSVRFCEDGIALGIVPKLHPPFAISHSSGQSPKARRSRNGRKFVKVHVSCCTLFALMHRPSYQVADTPLVLLLANGGRL